MCKGLVGDAHNTTQHKRENIFITKRILFLLCFAFHPSTEIGVLLTLSLHCPVIRKNMHFTSYHVCSLDDHNT